MFLNKNIWLIFYVLLLVGTAYLFLSFYLIWNDIQSRAGSEMSYVNKVFSSSVASTFDQQEIMLELLGQQLLRNRQYIDRKESSRILDRLLTQNRALVGFGLASVDGDMLATSSNINISKMPNLKRSETSRISFEEAVRESKMVIGKTYYLSALSNWVIPIRKAIRDSDNQLLGVMTAGIKPESLLPGLNQLGISGEASRFQTMLLQDSSFDYVYLSGISDEEISKTMQNVSTDFVSVHEKAVREQLGFPMSRFKDNLVSAEYFAPDGHGKTSLYSTVYIPKYNLWSIAHFQRDPLVRQFIGLSAEYTVTYLVVFAIIFLLFRYIYRVESQRHQILVDQANHDSLTGLGNRFYLEKIEPNWIYKMAKPFSVSFIDLDNFKNINDSHGHTYGDLILKQVAARISSFFPAPSVVCRQGGDEFIILSYATDLVQLEISARDLLSEISRPYKIGPYRFVIGASIGICQYPQDGTSFNSLFSAADTAMYRAKNKRNDYCLFTDELRQQISFTSKIEQALHRAINNDEFYMVYQPQITGNGKVHGIEALIRWRNPELGNIRPDQFIAIAEDSGLIIELGHFVIDQSIKDAVRLRDIDGFADVMLSINVSVRQFLEDNFLAKLEAALKVYEFPYQQLTLEITESIFIDDFEYMLPRFNEIRSLGMNISLDDFGTGYSSLSMLRKLPLDELKIDKSFIDLITENSQDKAMVLNIFDIASHIGLRVVAEGIETEAQAMLLRELGCDIHQGYYYARPMEIAALLKTSQDES